MRGAAKRPRSDGARRNFPLEKNRAQLPLRFNDLPRRNFYK
jgi:hypothetical protein